ECSHHRLHLFEDLVISEIVDETNRPAPPGEFGARVLVTVLFSHTQPLIRYEMSDRVMLSPERCDCGMPFALLGGIEGRAEDILQLPVRDGGTVHIHPNVFHELLESLPVQAWQVVQEHDAIRLLLQQPGAGIDIDGLSAEVVRALERQKAISPPVRVERVEAVTKSATGKVPLIRAYSRSPLSN